MWYGGVVLRVVRGLLLLGLASWFVYALLSALRHERPDLLHMEPDGFDPGVRILLTDRQRSAPRHREIDIQVVQDARLVSPDDPLDVDRLIPAGGLLTLTPDPVGTITVSLSGPVPERWQVRTTQTMRLSLVPGETSGIDAIMEQPHVEAANRLPLFVIGGRSYRGTLHVVVERGGWLHVINALPIEAYTAATLANEMHGAYPPGALHAQAIILRSQAYSHRQHPTQEFDGLLIYDMQDTHPYPAYRGEIDKERRISWASNDTRGLLLTAYNEPFAPPFHPSSGGRSAPASALGHPLRTITGRSLANVLIPVDDPWCQPGAEALGLLDSHWRTVTSFDRGELRGALRAERITDDFPGTLRVRRDANASRVTQVTISLMHNPDPLTLAAERFQQIIGAHNIPSLRWADDSPRELRRDDNFYGFEIVSYGRGHGVGLSQVSAYAMGRQGWSAASILAYFFPGSEIQRWW